jgi:CRP-like cAMP-binding protein
MMLDTNPDARFGPGPHECDLIALLRGVGRRRHYPRGSLVFAEGDDAHEVLLVTSGTVKVLVTACDGRQVVIEMSDAGELLGELAALDGARRTATAVAVTPVDVVTVPVSTFRQMLRVEPGAAEALIDVLAARLRAAASRHVELGAADAVARVCSRLDEMAARYGMLDSSGRIVLDTPITQLDLAQWAGLSREAVVKALRSLRSVGWITIRGRNIILLDREAIARRAQQ